jgi:segregation and condensation protein B
MQDLKPILESILFVADEPLSVERLKAIVETAQGQDIRAALQALLVDYQNRGGGFYLSEVAGGWQLRTRPEYHAYIKRLLQPSPQRLSRATLETLSIIAYKQPIIRADIEHIRGVDCGGVLRQLLERKLIRVLGRKEIPGRPLIYATTKTFLELFDLKDLTELPSPVEIEQMTAPAPRGDPEDPGSVTAQPLFPVENEDGFSGSPETAEPQPLDSPRDALDKDEKALD